MDSRSDSTRGERWFGRLVAITAVLGVISYYLWPHAYIELAFVALALVVMAIVLIVRAGDRRRGFAARADAVDRETWQSTLPIAQDVDPDRDHAI